MGNRNLIRFDWAIKRLLRNKADFTVLEGFLAELLKEDVFIESILESESNQRIDLDKFNRVDILVKNSKDELVIIEIQNQNEYDYFHRMAYGASKVLTSRLDPTYNKLYNTDSKTCKLKICNSIQHSSTSIVRYIPVVCNSFSPNHK